MDNHTELQALHEKVLGIRASVDLLEADITLLKKTLECRGHEVAIMEASTKRIHHDYQGVRQIVLALLDELERLAPRPK